MHITLHRAHHRLWSACEVIWPTANSHTPHTNWTSYTQAQKICPVYLTHALTLSQEHTPTGHLLLLLLMSWHQASNLLHFISKSWHECFRVFDLVKQKWSPQGRPCLEPYKSSKMPSSRLVDSIVFWLVEKKITKHKNFSNSGIGVARIFDRGTSIRKSHAIWRHQKFLKERFLWDKIILEWKIRRLALRWVGKKNFAKGGGLEPKVNVLKICVKLRRRGEETNVTNCITD